MKVGPAGHVDCWPGAPDCPGLYVVALTHLEPIPVNARDHRLAARCIKVDHTNCMFGKSRNLALRQRAYWRTFGREFVRFRPIALLEDIDAAERSVLARLSAWRVRGSTGRPNEWLAGISASEVEQIAVRVLAQSGIEFRAFDVADWPGPEATGHDTPRPPGT